MPAALEPHTAAVLRLEPSRAVHLRALRRERNKRWWKRSKSGTAIAPVEYNSEIINVLIELHYLEAGDNHTAQQVGAAITAALRSLYNNR
jgi:hypothetical protein